MLITMGRLRLRRNCAPVNGPMYGTAAAEAIGSAALEVGVPTRAEQSEHLLLLDEPAGVGDGQLRLVGVVERDEFEPPPVDPACPVGLLEGGEDPEPHALAERRRRAGEGRGLAEEDAVLAHSGDAFGGACRARERGGGEGEGEDGAEPGPPPRPSFDVRPPPDEHARSHRFLVRVRWFNPSSRR